MMRIGLTKSADSQLNLLLHPHHRTINDNNKAAIPCCSSTHSRNEMKYAPRSMLAIATLTRGWATPTLSHSGSATLVVEWLTDRTV